VIPIDRGAATHEEKMMMSWKRTAYWAATAIVALCMLLGGTANLVHLSGTVEGIAKLGYPLYFVTILGFWKVLAGVALLAPRFPRVKEWAYAGVFVELTGAAASHAACGDDPIRLIAPLTFAALTAVSWALRPQSRTLGPLVVGWTPARARLPARP
jgi:uncharacterized membrane protein YphA (DoxX/SURF4 family)